ncbi:type IV pilus twitching motility protein PilT [Thermosediminibacter oceani]|uniref:Twitching motility protein n=1 Tax=Thermosediminibacter oceani (strain ATCC BAA-1034 / DSM 16646 / JW/IW-1228P) TaxID=555079 RepID=D9RZA4_THEOJ|nr:type IV pilus twitching motility protein PilT [Thermosediminibacter oceani]ADL08658.1 twitching motility protein [Thermosediminibacter oceani DSM 16646]
MHLREILGEAIKKGASDIHLTVGLPPVFRHHGRLEPQGQWPPLTASDTEALAREILGERWEEFIERKELDLAYSAAGLGRFRVNIFHQRGSIGAALRLVGDVIHSLDELGLPPVVGELADQPHGLVLVTGPTGSGKTTTLAAMIDRINERRSCHIITLEDPIEYLHTHKRSIVNQREIGSDSPSFASALRAALRQDPDVILVGEMRDLETVATAITAAETGHLVLATLHTGSAVQSIDRIIDVFPPHQQNQIRIQLSDTLAGVITQQLLPRADGKGRVVAVEVLIATPAVRNLIREGKTHQIVSLMQTGGRFGMQTMEMSLRQLREKGLIHPDLYQLKKDFG